MLGVTLEPISEGVVTSWGCGRDVGCYDNRLGWRYKLLGSACCDVFQRGVGSSETSGFGILGQVRRNCLGR